MTGETVFTPTISTSVPKAYTPQTVRVNRYADAQKAENRPQTPKDGDVKSAVENLNSALSSFQVKRQYRVDEDLNRVVVRIVSPEDNKVVRQIPTEKALQLAKNLRSMTGLLFDEVA